MLNGTSPCDQASEKALDESSEADAMLNEAEKLKAGI